MNYFLILELFCIWPGWDPSHQLHCSVGTIYLGPKLMLVFWYSKLSKPYHEILSWTSYFSTKLWMIIEETIVKQRCVLAEIFTATGGITNAFLTVPDTTSALVWNWISQWIEHLKILLILSLKKPILHASKM